MSRLRSDQLAHATCAWCGAQPPICTLVQTLVSTYPACPTCYQRQRAIRMTDRTSPSLR